MLEQLEAYFTNYWNRFLKRKADQQVAVEFYKYRSTFLKIFKKDYGALLRFSKRLEDAPVEVLKAGGREMIHRILGLRPLATDRVIFQQFLAELGKDVEAARAARPLLPPKGKHVDLNEVYEKVTGEYFNEQVRLEGFGWSRRPVKSYFAHYRRDLDRITFNRGLDHPDVPEFILEYLMFHELLHVVYTPMYVNNRHVKHPPELKKREREFALYQDARKWLKKKGNKLIR